MLKKVILMMIDFYRRFISPMTQPRCRFYPTCSTYGRQAILWHGVWRGVPMTLGRLLRCQPWGGSGVDFVPLPMYRYRYDFVGFGQVDIPWRSRWLSYKEILNIKFTQ